MMSKHSKCAIAASRSMPAAYVPFVEYPSAIASGVSSTEKSFRAFWDAEHDELTWLSEAGDVDTLWYGGVEVVSDQR
jgi:hypothetical protein